MDLTADHILVWWNEDLSYGEEDRPQPSWLFQFLTKDGDEQIGDSEYHYKKSDAVHYACQYGLPVHVETRTGKLQKIILKNGTFNYATGEYCGKK